MSEVHAIKFHKQSINTVGLDWIFAYPLPTSDSPFSLTPLSIMFPGKMMEDQGCTVEYWDARWDPPEMLDDYIREAKNIGVSAFTGHQCAYAADILERAKQINPKIITHIGGHHARLCTEDVKREPFVDQVWPNRSYHEHSFPFSKAAQRLWKRGDWQYLTSNGCPYACGFCALRSAWEPRGLDQVEREINVLAELTGFKEVSFLDPNIGYHKHKIDGVTHRINRVERMKAIGSILKPLGIRWDGNVRSDYVDEEYTQALADSGCYSLEFGAESGDDWFLKNVIKKGHGTSSIRNANRCMAGSGISIMNSFIKGCPGETREQWLHTAEFIDELVAINPEARVSCYRFTPYPGGPLYDCAVRGEGVERFDPPKTMREWGNMPLMVDPVYWTVGLNFRMDNTTKNFPGSDWALIEPFVLEARRLWKERRPEDFAHSAEVERLIEFQIRKHNAQVRAVA